jgi:hypothetical protein
MAAMDAERWLEGADEQQGAVTGATTDTKDA